MALSIKTKLIILGGLLTFIPTLIVNFIISSSAIDNASISLQASAEKKLTVVRETTAEHVQDYFKFINDQMVTFSNDKMIKQAMTEFSSAYQSLENDIGTATNEEYLASVKSYYRNQYERKFKKLNKIQVRKLFV